MASSLTLNNTNTTSVPYSHSPLASKTDKKKKDELAFLTMYKQPVKKYIPAPFTQKGYNAEQKREVMQLAKSEIGMTKDEFYKKLGDKGLKEAWCAYYLSHLYEQITGETPWGYKGENKDKYLSFVTEIKDWSKKAGNYTDVNAANRDSALNKIKSGDILYFQFRFLNNITHTGNHVGLVEKVLKNGTIVAIEGNSRVTSTNNYVVTPFGEVTRKSANFKPTGSNSNKVIRKAYVPGDAAYYSIVGYTHID